MHEAVRAVRREAPGAAGALDRLERFQDAATGSGIPAVETERWLNLARPCVLLTREADGPVVARLGGPLLLPPDVATPSDPYELGGPDGGVRHADHQLIATLDLAAIPEGATDLPLPPDGQLLLFANPDLEIGLAGGALYVPAGVAVEERATAPDYEPYEYESPEELDADLRRRGELRLAHDVTLPQHAFDAGLLARHPRAGDLREVWEDTRDDRPWHVRTLQIGGHAWDHEDWGDPAAGQDRVLLAQWEGLPMATVYWTMTRQDLEALRFDRVTVTMYSNP
ncbi:hypothetical protein GCM10010413_01370 [Promicromonospora sukumoe]|uniref:DUF1963 domain-containing protein n=1 Tax=Promicromonospora sukumoe TaxID=88382 RepID=A0A7W3PH16_9MICO|nr:DUF1963 domain-containing protein [Promicromonospora sukumoe]MBA8811391.1 hypothetical protein [Promicromonospora sukumoe]